MNPYSWWETVPAAAAQNPYCTYYMSSSGVYSLPDLQLISADAVRFDTHCWRVLQSSTNRLGYRLPPHCPPDGGAYILLLDEPGTVLSVVMRGMYILTEDSGTEFPALYDVLAALDALQKYGIAPHIYLSHPSPIRSYLLHYMRNPHDAVLVYAFAADHGLADIVKTASSHLLNYPIVFVNDALAARMGPLFFLRLAKLQERRVELLRELILQQPTTHAPRAAPHCSLGQRDALVGAWANASADIGWQISPDLPINTIRKVLGHIEGQIVCGLCKEKLRLHIQGVLLQWSIADREISLEGNDR